MPRAILSILTAFLLAPATGHAFLVQERGALESAANGIVLGPDGNLWVTEQSSGSVVRLAPDGTVVSRHAVGADPTTIAVGPGNRVWVAVTGAKQLVYFDATAPAPAPVVVATGSTCGPVGLAAGGDGRMYFTLPSDGACNGGASELGTVAGDGTGPVTRAAAGGGRAYDLEASGGKLYVPDFDGDVIRRVSQGTGFSVETSVGIPTSGGAPNGIAADAAGNLWVTEFSSGKVARFAPSQSGGAAVEFTPAGGTLTNPFGIVASADGHIYVAGRGSANVVRLDGDGTGFAYYGIPGSGPFTIVDGPDGDLYLTDQDKPRILRFVNAAPRVQTGAAAASGAVEATVDPRGNDTQVVFDYGTTTAYGSTTAPTAVPSGAAPVPVSATLTGLAPGTTYHVRARATNAEGETSGADATFTTPPAAAPPARLAAKTAFKLKVKKKTGVTVVKRIVISGLVGTETATIRCTGKRCPFKAKTFKLAAGKRTFGRSLLKGRKLRRGTVVSVQVTAPETIGTSTVLTVRKGKKPKTVRACLAPGATKPSACS